MLLIEDWLLNVDGELCSQDAIVRDEKLEKDAKDKAAADKAAARDKDKKDAKG